MRISDVSATTDIVRRIEHVREHLVVVEYKLEKLVEKAGDRIV